MAHNWPTDQETHIWTNWYLETSREGAKPAVQYRSCVHPQCHEVQHREVT